MRRRFPGLEITNDPLPASPADRSITDPADLHR